jgi:hypothetical protein
MNPSTLHIVEDGKVENLNVFVRGNATRKGELTPRRFLSVLTNDDAPEFRPTAAAGASSRRPSRTGTIRSPHGFSSIAFGASSSATPSSRPQANFGNSGAKPSCPELLDDLAVRFMERGWSVKSLVKEIVLSSTYRQGSCASTEQRALDPDNELLGRMNRRRLSVEQWRDAVLATSGELIESVGARSQELDDRNNRERTVYARVSRLKLNDLLMQWDYPDANVHAEKRSVTVTPIQKLFVLNSPFMQRQAGALAARLQGSAEGDDERVSLAYRLLFSRDASPDERTLALDFLRKPNSSQMSRWSNTRSCCSPLTKCSMWTNPNSCCGPSLGGTLLNRRQMLQRMCAGFGFLGLSSLIESNAFGSAHFAPRAKRVVFLFMNGGPSHIDTFDPKPELAKYEGQQPTGELYKKSKGTGFMPSSFAFNKCGQSGIDVCETLPNLARMIDDCCIIRSMHTDVPNHEPALLQMHTGNMQPIRPAFGSWLLYGLGTENQNLPGYVVLRPSPKIVVGPALWSSSFLPAKYQATSVITADMAIDKLIGNIRNSNLETQEQREQLDLLGELNRKHLAQRANDGELEGQIRAMETAFHMQREAMETFDISREPESVRTAYGDTPFARSCLLARRLLESGVRVVTVYYTSSDNQPWDTHANHAERHPKLCADSDQATAALIGDLKQRGMLEDTLVIWAVSLAGRRMLKTKRRTRPAAITITRASPCCWRAAA